MPCLSARRACGYAVAIMLLLCGSAGAAMPPPSVSVIVVGKQPVYHEQSYTGRIRAARIVNLVPRVTGYLVQRLFHQGMDVKKGQVLYVIEPGPYRAAFDQANASVAAAKATLADAKLALERAAKLLHSPAGQRSTYDTALATEHRDAAQLDAARAQRATAAINLSYTQIRSPIDGRIGRSNVNVGNVVGPTTGTLATVVSQDPMDVTFSMPTRDATRLRSELAHYGGLKAVQLLLRLPDGRTDKQTGTLDFTANQIDQSTDTLYMQGTIANPVIPGLDGARVDDRELTSGEFVTVIVRSRHPKQEIVLPRDAVLADELGNYVLAVNAQSKVVRKNVTLSQTTASTATIAGGLSLGAKVIINGIEKVHPGLTVTAQVVKSPVA